ncbi:MAG: SDR family oxidoreductase [Spirochaetes bacterium]|nr:SDR family oxidoreductase [Spirochaetota bacterium]
MAKKILITGGAGFVAGNIIKQSLNFTLLSSGQKEEIRITALDKYRAVYKQNNLVWLTADLLEKNNLQRILKNSNPDVIIHLAALSDIDYCEANKGIAEKINVGVTKILVDFCSDTGCRLIYFSSDSVFDGKKGLYKEEDIPEPLHFYGKTKIASENIIRETIDNYVIIRPSLIMGLPVFEEGNSFLRRMIKSLKRGEQAAFPKAEIRSPVDAITLSRSVLELSLISYRGYLHIAGNDILTRYDMAKRIAEKLNYPGSLIIDKKPKVLSGRAPRPADVSLDNSKAKGVLKTPMAGLDKGLELIIENRGNKAL